MTGGDSADRFSVLGELGRGGMATVVLARDGRTGEEVALKLLHAHLSDQPSARRRVAREVAASQQVRHPAVLAVREVVEVEGRLGLVLPVCRGGSLPDLLAREGPLPEARLRELLRAVGGALQAAHAEGVLHRDVAPGNVLVHDGAFVLADFGVARVALGHTATTTALGTPGYAPPEAWDGTGWDPRADAYGLGGVLYFAATGTAPFGGEAGRAAIQQQLDGAHVPLAQRRPDLPAGLCRTVDALLHPDAERRLDVPGALAGVAPLPAAADARPPLQWTQVGTALSMLALVALGWFQDLGGFLLATIIDGHAIPKPDIFEMTQGVSALLLLPLCLLPAIVGALKGRGDAVRRQAPWIGIAVLAVVDLLYAMAAGVILPEMSMRGTADMFGTMMFHLGAFVPISAVVLLLTRPWQALRAETAPPPPVVGPEAAARAALDSLSAALADAPAAVRADLSERVRSLRAEVDGLAAELPRLAADRAAVDADPAALSRLEGRLARARTLGEAGAAALAEALASREAALAEAEALDARRTRALARLLEIGGGARRARRELQRGEREPGDALAELEAGARAARAAAAEVAAPTR